ncbi:hypothetical protein SAMD00019534_089900 [Acytostelium subglobosum LB1]|uniref:hypothetical protein n=1 Tax=Acytostelium subglobosum LB1 TaxID=1410327 RepID=UPI000644B767|nr:hypothetical protein SAMD00019534_089900 [Acytostelium subglobosum LB1]GAM25815.1 hypothetical protein SAMD00019534_089900 [Acytostelium subglobosum LB1]|eukprot:XP_012751333.1 hypothetical protein SAMD00019534_089900 [Acytostelium subglobosum LB1]
MFIVSLLLSLLIIVLFHYSYTLRKKGGNAPPGPFAWPIIGNLHLIADGRPQIGLFRLYQKFGKVFHIWMGSVYTVVLCEPDVIKEAFINQGSLFNDRPTNLTTHIVGGENNVAFTNGAHWTKLRGIVSKALTKAKTRQMETLILGQFEKMCEAIQDDIKAGKPFYIRPYLRTISFSVMMTFLFGKEISFKPKELDPEFTKMISDSQRLANLMSAGNPGDYIKFLRPFNSLNKFDDLELVVHDILEFAKKYVKEHLDTIDRSNPRDFMDQLIIEYEKDQVTDNVLDYSSIHRICLDILVGGTDTGATTIEWLVLLMANHPVEQELLNKELLTCIDSDEKYISSVHKPLLPILNSTIKEAWRYRPVAPLALPHKSTEDCTVGGYFIPKGSQILINIYSASMSEKLWEEPTKFDAFRFIKDDSRTMVFGEGPRKCVGFNFAETEVFLLVSNLFKRFKFVRPSDELLDDAGTVGITLEPAPFDVLVENR